MKHVRYITDAAMLTAIVMVVLIISHYTGLEIEELFPFLLSVPVAIYTMHYGFKKGIIPALAISFLSMLHNPLHSLFFVVSSNVIALLYGLSLKNKHQAALRIIISITGSFLINFLTLWIFSSLLYGYTIYDDVQATISLLFDNFNIADENIKAIINACSQGLIPSFILLLSIFEGLCFHLLTTLLFNRIFKHDHLYTPITNKFKIPKIIWVLYLLIFLVVVIFVPQCTRMTGFLKIIWIIGVNLVVIGGTLFVFILLVNSFRKIKENKGGNQNNNSLKS